MSELVKALSNIRSLRVIARENSLESMESMLEKLTIVVEEKREAIKAQEFENQQRLERLNKYKELLAQDGISADELALLLGNNGATVESKKREPRPAKYKFVDEQGNEKTWTGQGRMPLTLQHALKAGKSLADFEI
ncbi:DNA-binding protein H-NS-like protein [Pasteurellaceae bacterium Macca]|nr:DNA-binding protein H-NS-like protein [Pasteurellaceae bacterium Macca]